MKKRAGSVGSFEECKEPVPVVRIVEQSSRRFPLRFLLVLLGVVVFFSLSAIRYIKEQNEDLLLQSRFDSCAERNSIFTWIRPPSNIWHHMNDTELFWRASFVPTIQKFPYKRIPKIAFMFLTKGALPMAPLWDKFLNRNQNHYSIYIHSMPSYQPDFPPSSAFYGRQIPSKETEWGSISMCDAERRLIANALLDLSNQWFVLLSESCIPLQNFNVIYQYLSRSRFSFIASYDEPGPYGRGRYNDFMSPEVNLTNWRKGSQWFEVNRKLAVDIIQDDVYYPKFDKFCRPACYVDEHYFPTILTIHSSHLLANRSVTWVDWSRGGAHPAVFGKDDVTHNLFNNIFNGAPCLYNNQPTTMCFLFARKFAPSALDLLLEHSSDFFGF